MHSYGMKKITNIRGNLQDDQQLKGGGGFQTSRKYHKLFCILGQKVLDFKGISAATMQYGRALNAD